MQEACGSVASRRQTVPPPDRTRRIGAKCALRDAQWNLPACRLQNPLRIESSRCQRDDLTLSRLVGSELALRSLVALSQRLAGVRTAELAAILGAPISSCQRAVEVLADDGLVERADHRSRLVDSPRAAEAVRFALSAVPPDGALAALARANPAVEFCGMDGAGVIMVVRRFAEPADEARLVHAVVLLRTFHPDRRIDLVGKAELREELLDDLAPRRRAQAMRFSRAISSGRSQIGRDTVTSTRPVSGGSIRRSRP